MPLQALPAGDRGTPPPSPAGGAGTVPDTNPGSAGSDNSVGLLQTPDASQAMMMTSGMMMPMMDLPAGPISIDQTGPGNPAGLSDPEVKTLVAGGAPGSMKWLYPYDGTVFPRGMIAPMLMWDGPVADVVYLHIQSTQFEYKGVLKAAMGATMGPQLQIPQDVWDKAGKKTQGKSDTFNMELTARAGGSCDRSDRAALHDRASHREGLDLLQHLRVGFTGCRSRRQRVADSGGRQSRAVLVDGLQRLSLGRGEWFAHDFADRARHRRQLVSARLGRCAESDGHAGRPAHVVRCALSDGSKYLSTSVAMEVARAALAQGLGAPADATLYDTTTGQVVPDTAVPPGALMPMFSPDGTQARVQRLRDRHGPRARGDGLRREGQQGEQLQDAVHEASRRARARPGWPFFLPDEQGRIVRPHGRRRLLGRRRGHRGHHHRRRPTPSMSHRRSRDGQRVTILGQGDGLTSAAQDAANNTTYLAVRRRRSASPATIPTVSPVAAGGYFWIFFDAVRHYGNLGMQRQLWGAAVDIQSTADYTLDPSHPAFYLPGQEFGTGNHRAFAALDPCKKDGDTCATGIDCCGGTCYFPAAPAELVEPVGSCSPPR